MNLKSLLFRSSMIVFIVFLPVWLVLIWGLMHKEPETIISPVPDGEVNVASPIFECPLPYGDIDYIYPDEPRYSSIMINGCYPIDITPTPTKLPYKGKASYYSRAGCLGCSEGMIMANGEPLDDSRLTVAFNYATLDSMVRVVNQKTGKMVSAMVTDRGGFERHGKIIDLSVATRDAIGCGDVCDVEISL